MEIDTLTARERNHHSGGNERERLEVTSGDIVIADQFILSNPLLQNLSTSALQSQLTDYGAVVAPLERETYSVLRNPYEKKILIAPLGSLGEDFQFSVDDFSPVGQVDIDTRCLIIFDISLLLDSEFVSSYKGCWAKGIDGQKDSRDLIRSKGGAVRYGFSRQFEKLSVGIDRSTNERLAIWG